MAIAYRFTATSVILSERSESKDLVCQSEAEPGEVSRLRSG